MKSRLHIVDFRQGRGIVLPLTLILLVIISLLGIMALRNATVGSQTMNGIRAYTATEMAAESGLRYCEEVVKEAASPSAPPKYVAQIAQIIPTAYGQAQPIVGPNDANAYWKRSASWAAASANRITVDTSTTAGSKYTYPPQCIIEVMKNNSGTAYVITARGISNDAQYDATSGKVTSGSEVWVQSVLTPNT